MMCRFLLSHPRPRICPPDMEVWPGSTSFQPSPYVNDQQQWGASWVIILHHDTASCAPLPGNLAFSCQLTLPKKRLQLRHCHKMSSIAWRAAVSLQTLNLYLWYRLRGHMTSRTSHCISYIIDLPLETEAEKLEIEESRCRLLKNEDTISLRQALNAPQMDLTFGFCGSVQPSYLDTSLNEDYRIQEQKNLPRRYMNRFHNGEICKIYTIITHDLSWVLRASQAVCRPCAIWYQGLCHSHSANFIAV